MANSQKPITWMLIAAVLLSGCAQVTSAPKFTPTITPNVVTTSVVTRHPTLIPPTLTSIPPTKTPALTPTSTRLPSVETLRNLTFHPDSIPPQRLDLYLPPEGLGPFPVVILLHGGGGDKRDMASIATQLARQGYAAAALNFRDYPEFTYPAAVQDAFCGLAWIHANAATYRLDLQHVFALGYSFGGTLVAMLGIVDSPGIFMDSCPTSLPETSGLHGVITYTGLFDYASAAAERDLTNYVNRYLNSTQAESLDTWAEASALTWIDGSEPPFLIIHGEDDESIPPEQSQAFATTLQTAGVPAELLLVAGADHFGIIGDQNVFRAAAIFLDNLVP